MNKKIKWSIILILLASLIIYLDACKMGRFIYYNFSDITDHKIFPARPLTAAPQPYQYPLHPQPQLPAADIIFTKNDFGNWDNALTKTQSVAFIIIKDDTLQYEAYANQYDQSSIVASFSMAKSYIATLIGIAIHEGIIHSEQDPVTLYIPELEQQGFQNVTIQHLLQMTSGLDFDEQYYTPFAHAADFYYGTRLRSSIAKLSLKHQPGQRFEYVSGNSQLLGLILERALNGKTITQYLQEKIWTPLGMQYDASWSIDRKKEGLEKTFCCLNARAIDFAKFGSLILHQGNWQGQQIIPTEFIAKIYGRDLSQGASEKYQYHFWKGNMPQDLMARGHLGQYIYIDPDINLIVVRLGAHIGGVDWPYIFHNVSLYYRALEHYRATSTTGSPSQ